MTETLPFHPLADIFPQLEGAEFDDLVADIAAHGVREKGKLYEGSILDGRNRYRASLVAGADMEFEQFDGADPVAFVISANLRRRHMTESQRAHVAAKLATLREGRPTKTPSIDGVSEARASRLLNVSVPSVQRAKVVERKGAPELKRAVEAGKVKISAAAIIAGELPESEQVDIVARGSKELQKAASALRKCKLEKNRAKRTSKVIASAAAPAFPTGRRYPVIYADPPWRYENPHMSSTGRSIEEHYETMPLKAICALPVRELATDDAVLFLWTTVPHTYCSVPKVLDAWGFAFRSEIVWDKEKLGMGYWTRGQHEKLLICLRGKIDAPHGPGCPRSVYREPRGEHSAKPQYFYDMIEKMFPQFRATPPAPPLMIELFANVQPEHAREGWTVWGKPHRDQTKEAPQ
jgi:N6-adenosine-specific RNA methylase IME4